MNNQPTSNPQSQNNNSALGEAFKHGGKIAVRLAIVVMLAGIGAIALTGNASVILKTIIELSPDGFRVENEIHKDGAITE